MKFGRLPLAEAMGATLAHSVAAGSQRFKKGRVLTGDDIAALAEAGFDTVMAARMEAGDMAEDEAAALIAQAACGEGADTNAPFTGRCNLYARSHGLAVIDGARAGRLNHVDEAITIATLPLYEAVEPGQMLATVKIIPFSAPADAVKRCAAIAGDGGPLIRVAPFSKARAGLVLTRQDETKDSLLEKTVEAVEARLQSLDSALAETVTIPHHEEDVARAVSGLLDKGCDLVLIFGASAITDRRDVIPAGIERCGGVVDHFGMPVDPGNLLLLGHCGEVPVIGLPGCARSPKLNGFDWVLQRLLAGLPLGRDELMGMGVGGLLKEIPSRPQPREAKPPAPSPAPGAPRVPRIAALVLAAGQSRRMGPSNKLLTPVDGKPMVQRAVEAARDSAAATVTVVTGHEEEAVRAALAGLDVAFVHNPDYAQGLSASLKAGLRALPGDIDGVLVCLGDMPRIAPRHLDKLISAFNPVEGRAICVPTFQGKRGNPVLFARRFFAEILEVAGDVGAKHLIGTHDDLVCEVAVEDDAIFLDIDTPQALAALKGGEG